MASEYSSGGLNTEPQHWADMPPQPWAVLDNHRLSRSAACPGKTEGGPVRAEGASGMCVRGRELGLQRGRQKTLSSICPALLPTRQSGNSAHPEDYALGQGAILSKYRVVPLRSPEICLILSICLRYSLRCSQNTLCNYRDLCDKEKVKSHY